MLQYSAESEKSVHVAKVGRIFDQASQPTQP